MSWYLLSDTNLQRELFPEAHTANQTILKTRYVIVNAKILRIFKQKVHKIRPDTTNEFFN